MKDSSTNPASNPLGLCSILVDIGTLELSLALQSHRLVNVSLPRPPSMYASLQWYKCLCSVGARGMGVLNLHTQTLSHTQKI